MTWTSLRGGTKGMSKA